MSRDPRVDAYIAAAQPFAQPILRHLRELVHHHAPGAEETLKWSVPHFILNDRNLAGMAQRVGRAGVRRRSENCGAQGRAAHPQGRRADAHHRQETGMSKLHDTRTRGERALGRMQRYVNDVKADIDREMQIDELKKLQAQMQESARSFENSINAEARALQQTFDAGADSVRQAVQDEPAQIACEDASCAAVQAATPPAPEKAAAGIVLDGPESGLSVPPATPPAHVAQDAHKGTA